MATRVSRARFVHSPFTSEQMAGLGEVVLQSVVGRIKRGENCEDFPAKPLKPGRNGKKGYPEQKTAAGIAPIRNWISPIRWPKDRIKTLRALKVKAANENRVTIGFIDPRADRIAHFNNLHEKQFGLSPKDKQVLMNGVEAMGSPVSTQKIA